MIAFWLVPAAETKQYFETLISALAARCGAPVFEPHVTLTGGDITEERGGEILHALSLRGPIELEVEGVRYSEEYTKTLFVQFRSTSAIEELSNQIQNAVGGDYQLNPHLSLLYKEMALVEKEKLAQETSIPWQRVKFDRIKVIDTPHPITTREEVEAWRTLGERSLSGS